MQTVISLGLCGLMLSSSATVLGNMVRKVNKDMYGCWDGWCDVSGVSESDTRGSGDDFLVSLWILLFRVGHLRFSIAVDGMVLMGCEVVAIGLVNFGVMDSSIRGVGSCVVWRNILLVE